MNQGANGPEDVRETLVAYAPRVFGLIMRMVGHREVAEDLTQETLLRAWRNLDTYRPEGKLRAWLFRIAVNAARDWARRRRFEPTATLDETADGPALPVAAPDTPPDARVRRRETQERVAGALAQLPDADREILLLRYYGELTFKEIADANGEPLGTVLARAHRALKKLGSLFPEDEMS